MHISDAPLDIFLLHFEFWEAKKNHLKHLSELSEKIQERQKITEKEVEKRLLNNLIEEVQSSRERLIDECGNLVQHKKPALRLVQDHPQEKI
jgi:predicted transcriptional regulator